MDSEPISLGQDQIADRSVLGEWSLGLPSLVDSVDDGHSFPIKVTHLGDTK